MSTFSMETKDVLWTKESALGGVKKHYDTQVRQQLSKYKHRDLAQKDVMNVFTSFGDLTPKVEEYAFEDGSVKDLFCIIGCIPVNFKGAIYNIPVCIILMDTHPYNPPICFVRPTKDMQIKPSSHVDANGKIYLPYLHEWKYPKSDLAGLIAVMSVVFGEASPVFRKELQPAYPLYPKFSSAGSQNRQQNVTKRTTSSGDIRRQFDSQLRMQLSKYKYQDLTRQDVMNVLVSFELSPKIDKYVFNDGSEKDLLCLDGTIPICYKGAIFNIPICIFLMDIHPNHPPMCFVRPTKDMLIKPSKYLDANGRVYLPYLHEWKYPESDLKGLIQVMITVFGEAPPVFTKPPKGADSKYQYPPKPLYHYSANLPVTSQTSQHNISPFYPTTIPFQNPQQKEGQFEVSEAKPVFTKPPKGADLKYQYPSKPSYPYPANLPVTSQTSQHNISYPFYPTTIPFQNAQRKAGQPYFTNSDDIRKQCDAQVRQQLSKYKQNEQEDILNVLANFVTLKSKIEKYTFSDGSVKDLLCIYGNIPVDYNGGIYNIPICVYLMDTHPYNAPLCFVRPTKDMLIKTSKHVDANGKIYLPYLHEWEYPNSDLIGLIQVMIVVFGEATPVYTKPSQASYISQQNVAYRRNSGEASQTCEEGAEPTSFHSSDLQDNQTKKSLCDVEWDTLEDIAKQVGWLQLSKKFSFTGREIGQIKKCTNPEEKFVEILIDKADKKGWTLQTLNCHLDDIEERSEKSKEEVNVSNEIIEQPVIDKQHIQEEHVDDDDVYESSSQSTPTTNNKDGILCKDNLSGMEQYQKQKIMTRMDDDKQIIRGAGLIKKENIIKTDVELSSDAENTEQKQEPVASVGFDTGEKVMNADGNACVAVEPVASVDFQESSGEGLKSGEQLKAGLQDSATAEALKQEPVASVDFQESTDEGQKSDVQSPVLPTNRQTKPRKKNSFKKLIERITF